MSGADLAAFEWHTNTSNRVREYKQTQKDTTPELRSQFVQVPPVQKDGFCGGYVDFIDDSRTLFVLLGLLVALFINIKVS